jgi:hypothetical protein
VVAGASPVSSVLTATALVPDPALLLAVRLPYPVVVPYSTNHEVDWPPGSTEPPTVADVPVTLATGPVLTLGVESGAAPPRAVTPSPTSVAVMRTAHLIDTIEATTAPLSSSARPLRIV